MSFELFRDFLAWCSLINMIFLVIWFFFLVGGRGFLHRIHGKWFDLTEKEMGTIHYGTFVFYKICVIVFNLVPYLVLRLCV